MMYVGLDLSMRASGLVVLNDDACVVAQRRIGWKDRADTLHNRIAYFNRVAHGVQLAVTVLTGGEPFAMAIEDYAVHGPGDPTIAPELGGIVRLHLVDLSRQIFEVPPACLKKFACGKGNAQKDEIMLSVFKRWQFDCGGDNNVADAYVLARMVRAAVHGDDTLIEAQRDALCRAKMLENQ